MSTPIFSSFSVPTKLVKCLLLENKIFHRSIAKWFVAPLLSVLSCIFHSCLMEMFSVCVTRYCSEYGTGRIHLKFEVQGQMESLLLSPAQKAFIWNNRVVWFTKIYNGNGKIFHTWLSCQLYCRLNLSLIK